MAGMMLTKIRDAGTSQPGRLRRTGACSTIGLRVMSFFFPGAAVPGVRRTLHVALNVGVRCTLVNGGGRWERWRTWRGCGPAQAGAR